MTHEEVLSRYIRNWASVTDEVLLKILACFKPVHVKKNEWLLSQGQTSQRAFFVIKGCLRVYFINEQGQEATRHFALENTLVTSLLSFITEQPSKEFIQAVEDSEILVISHADFFRLNNDIPDWQAFYLHFLEYAYIVNTNRLMSFLTLDATERYQLLMQDAPHLIQRISNKLLASYLNVSQETMSRIKSKL